jgi:hypothetical protein
MPSIPLQPEPAVGEYKTFDNAEIRVYASNSKVVSIKVDDSFF